MSSEGSDLRKSADAHLMAPDWERACIVQLQHGHPRNFDRLVDHYSARIYAHLYRMVRNREEAEDLTQETFIRAYQNIARYDTTRPFRNWLYTIATNIARNAARTRGRRIPSATVEHDAGRVIADTQDPHLVETRELKERLRMAVDRLPEPLPMLIQLHYQEGLTIREAADILGMSEGAAKVALHRARKTLRIIMMADKTP